MLFNAPSGSSDANASYVGKNVAAGTQGSRVPPLAVEAPQREIVAIVAAAQAMGLDAPTNTDLRQMLKAVRSGLLNRFPATGTPDAVAIAPQPVYVALVEGMRFRFKMPGAAGAVHTTVTPTFAVNGLAPVPILRRDGAAPAKGDLVAGRVAEAEIDGAGAARIVGALASETVAAVLPYTPAGAKKKTAFTTYALTSIVGVNVDNTAQTLTVTGASYVDVTAATSIYYNADANSTMRTGVIARVALYQGATLVQDADYHIGSVLSPFETAPLVLRQVFQGLDPAVTYTIKLLVTKSQSTDNQNVNDTYLIAYYG